MNLLSLSELPECVEDFIVSDLDLEKVDRHVIIERWQLMLIMLL